MLGISARSHVDAATLRRALERMDAAWSEGEEHMAKLSVNAMIGLWDFVYARRLLSNGTYRPIHDAVLGFIDVYARTEDVDSLKHAPVLLQNQADQSHGFAGLAGAEEDARTRDQGHHGVRGLFAAVFWHRKQLDLSHPFVLLAKFEAGEPGGRSFPGDAIL